MFDIFKKKKKVAQEPEKKPQRKKSEKELATERGDPYVAILSFDVNPEDLASGSFELDWNDKFVNNLIRAGYQGKTDSDIVEMWFNNVCRNVVMETWEQEQAMAGNQARFTQSRDLGNGRTEIS